MEIFIETNDLHWIYNGLNDDKHQMKSLTPNSIICLFVRQFCKIVVILFL